LKSGLLFQLFMGQQCVWLNKSFVFRAIEVSDDGFTGILLESDDEAIAHLEWSDGGEQRAPFSSIVTIATPSEYKDADEDLLPVVLSEGKNVVYRDFRDKNIVGSSRFCVG
jgi:hypothetical protein